MASRPPADPLKGHDRYKKVKDLNQGKERKREKERKKERLRNEPNAGQTQNKN
jgi:hypothetical protein